MFVSNISYSDWSVKRRCFITTILQLCFSIFHYKGPRKVGGIQIQWYILASEDINPTWKTTEALLTVNNRVSLEVNAEKNKYRSMFH